MAELLLLGHDTIECAYPLGRDARGGLDFERLAATKEALRASKGRHAAPVRLGQEEFLLAPHGTASGYPFLLANGVFSVQCGPTNTPSFFVTYRSFGLWQFGAMHLHERFLSWAASVGFIPVARERLSRVDFSFDYRLADIDFTEEHFVTQAAKDNKHRLHGRDQTFRFGEGQLVLRVYDKCAEIQEKSAKTWFHDLWGTDRDVWRIEWQVRKEWLRRFGIRTLEGLFERQGDLLRVLANEHTTLRKPTADSNRSRWPLHPLWRDLQARIAKLEGQGVYRELAPERLRDERMLRLAISVYGYLKRMAAIRGLSTENEQVTLEHAMVALAQRLKTLHEPVSWGLDVRRRIDEMRLGPW